MIEATYFGTALNSIMGPVGPHAQMLARTVICTLVLADGRVVIGSAQSDNRELAGKLAHEMAMMNIKEAAC